MLATDKVLYVNFDLIFCGTSVRSLDRNLLDIDEIDLLRYIRPIIINVTKNILHLFIRRRGRISNKSAVLFSLTINSLFVKLSFLKERAKSLVFSPLAAEHFHKGFFLVECRVIVEYAFILILRYRLLTSDLIIRQLCLCFLPFKQI